MHRQAILVIVFSTLLLSTCTLYDQSGAVTSLNGLSCQNRTDFVLFGVRQSASCYYRCADTTIRQPTFPERFSTTSPLYSASKAELEEQLCRGTLPPAPIESPIPVASSEPVTASPTLSPSPTSTPTEQIVPSPTQETPAATQDPLLSGGVTMCDMAVRLINFRMIEPVPDLTSQAPEVQIADQETTCYVNEVNPSLLTCRIPSSVIFPARVVVRLEDAVVNDFIYDGAWCGQIATAFPTSRP